MSTSKCAIVLYISFGGMVDFWLVRLVSGSRILMGCICGGGPSLHSATDLFHTGHSHQLSGVQGRVALILEIFCSIQNF
jgi:hypothetical protein